MAIQWGSYGSTGTGLSYRVGVDLSIAYPGGALDPTDTQATITGKVYVQMASGHTGYGINGRVVITGDHSQTTDGINWSVNSGGGTAQLLTFTDTVSLIYGSSQTYSVTARFRGVTTWNFTPSKKATITVPARPYQRPAAQTSLSVARSSDTRQNLSWTRNATTAAPYSSQEVWRSVDGGSYARVASLSGTATSWSDTSTSANRRYTYRLRAVNSAGTSGYSNTDAISTTPATPSAPTAAKLSNGDIRITRPSLSSVAVNWQVREVGGAVLATLSASTTTWAHPTPDPQVTHTYEIRAVSSDPTLYSGWSADSNTVQLLTPPAAPTNLAPNGAVRDAAKAIVLTWAHNPIDTTEQTRYQLRYRVKGSSFWTTPLPVLYGNQTATITADTWTNGQVIEWEVRTWGAHTDPSPWSATATFTLSTPPVVGITNPTFAQVIDHPSHIFEWSYFQAEGRAQASWQVELWTGNLRRASANGSGTRTSWNSGPILQNGQTYTFRARVYDNLGAASDWDEVTFTVDYTPPLEPEVQGQWYDEGFVMLQMTPVNGGVAPETTSFTIERQIDGGPWVTLATDLPTDTEYLDRTAAPNGTNTYRVTAVSDLPSMASTTYDVVASQNCYLYLNGGPGLSVIVRLRVISSRSLITGRRRVLNEYAGRFAPVETSGQMVPWEMSVSATMMPAGRTQTAEGSRLRGGCSSIDQSDVDELEMLFSLPGPHLMRDGEGRYETVTLSDLSADLLYLGEVSFTMTRSSPATSEQLAAIMAYVGPVLTEGPLGEYRIVGGTTTSGDQGEWTWTP